MRKTKRPEASVSEMTGRVFPIEQTAFQELLLFVEGKEAQLRVPDLAGKRSLEIAPRQLSLTRVLQEKGSAVIARVGGQKEQNLGASARGSFVYAHWENLPFVDRSWDFILLRTAYLRGGMTRLLREVGRVISKEGKVLMVDFHPFSLTVQSEHLKSAATEEGMGPGFERYFKLFREAGLRIESIREIFYEGSHKKFFGSDAASFDRLKKTPFLILFLLDSSAATSS